jgi:CRP-like cAMP-binding protein
MGDKMHRRIKTLAISAAVVAVVLSVLVLAKYFNAGLALAVANSHRLAAALPNLTNLSEHLDIGRYRSYLKDIALIAFLFLLLLWRALLLRRSQN